MAAPTIDGNTSFGNSTTSSQNASITTKNPQSIIIVAVTARTSGRNITSVSSPNTTNWRRLTKYDANTPSVDIWYGNANAVLTNELITVNTNIVSLNWECEIMWISGAAFGAPLDTNASVPKSTNSNNSTPTVTAITTDTATDLILCFVGSETSKFSQTVGTGFTLLDNATAVNNISLGIQYKTTTSALSAESEAFGTSDNSNWSMIVVAIVPAISSSNTTTSTFKFINMYLNNVAATSTDTGASGIGFPTNPKVFFSGTRLWLFYSDGTNLQYTSSADRGITWAAAVSAGACADGNSFSTYYDVVRRLIYYVRTSGNIVYWRSGTPNSNGTITWSQTVELTTGPSVSSDGTAPTRPSIYAFNPSSVFLSYSYVHNTTTNNDLQTKYYNGATHATLVQDYVGTSSNSFNSQIFSDVDGIANYTLYEFDVTSGHSIIIFNTKVGAGTVNIDLGVEYSRIFSMISLENNTFWLVGQQINTTTWDVSKIVTKQVTNGVSSTITTNSGLLPSNTVSACIVWDRGTTLYLIYFINNSNAWQLRAKQSTDSGSTWGAEQKLGNFSIFPNTTAGACGFNCAANMNELDIPISIVDALGNIYVAQMFNFQNVGQAVPGNPGAAPQGPSNRKAVTQQ